MFLRVEPSSSTPIYCQLAEQIREQIAAGLIKPGQQVPSVRQLAADLAVNQNTVLKVYNELVREGVLTMERGNGTFVSERMAEQIEGRRQQIVGEALARVVDKALNLNIPLEQLQELLEKEYRKQRRGKP
jgi:GntR family transcriptional regulator